MENENIQLLSVAEIAEILSVSKTTARRYTKDKTFPNPFILPTGTLRWDANEFNSWLQNLQPNIVYDLGQATPKPPRPGLTQKQRQATGPSKQRQAAQRLAEKIAANEK